MHDLPQLMAQFAGLEGARIGHGYRHPTQPDDRTRQDTLDFLAQYAAVQRDPGYVAFLEGYAGASATEPNLNLGIVLYGFLWEVAPHILYADGPVVDEDGFLTFCDGYVRLDSDPEANLFAGVLYQAFSFDMTGARQWGIYRHTRQADDPWQVAWYCPTFLDWLALMIARRGRLPAVFPGV